MERIDNLLAAGWRIVLRPLCAVTGWSNFRWARIVLFAAWVLTLWYPVLQPTNPFSWLIQPVFLWQARDIIIKFRKLEQLSNDPLPVKAWPLGYFEWSGFVFKRVLWGLAGTLWLLTGLQNLAIVVLSTSMYFATDFRPKQPSLLKRAVHRLVRVRIHIRLPKPAPQPA